MNTFPHNDIAPLRRDRTASPDSRAAGLGRGKLTALRLRALATITSALEAELLSMEIDVLGTEPGLSKDITIDFYEAVESFQKNLLLATLAMERGSLTRAARRLSLKIPTLHSMLKRYGIDPRMYK